MKLISYIVRHGTTQSNEAGLFRGNINVQLDSKGLSDAVQLTKDLRAWNLGYLGGQVKAEHQTEVQFYQDNPDEEVPRGESLNHFRTRVQPVLKHAFLRGLEGPHPSLIVGHSSIIHEASHLLHGDHTYIKVKPGGVVGVYHGAKGFELRGLVKTLSDGQGADHYGS